MSRRRDADEASGGWQVSRQSGSDREYRQDRNRSLGRAGSSSPQKNGRLQLRDHRRSPDQVRSRATCSNGSAARRRHLSAGLQHQPDGMLESLSPTNGEGAQPRSEGTSQDGYGTARGPLSVAAAGYQEGRSEGHRG